MADFLRLVKGFCGGPTDRRRERVDLVAGAGVDVTRAALRALGLAAVTGGGSSIPEVQRLLAVLVASKPNGKIAEIGTAFGDGAKAILAALGPDATFVTVEPAADRYSQAAAALEGTRAELLNAGWEDVLPDRGSFDLIFFDGGARSDTLDLAIGLLAPGGILLKDDLTPGEDGLAPGAGLRDDALRQAFLADERLAGVELLATTNMAVIIATRR